MVTGRRCGRCMAWYWPLERAEAVRIVNEEIQTKEPLEMVRLAIDQQEAYCRRCLGQLFPGIFGCAPGTRRRVSE